MPRQARQDAPGTLHHVILRGMENGQMVTAREDGESVPARLGVSTSGIAKAVARAERRSVH